MPSSDASNISTILKIVKGINPNSILDVGIGNGKYGLLFREYVKGHEAGEPVHDKQTWKMRLDGIEIFETYITDVQRYLYTNIYIVDAFKFLMDSKNHYEYDLIFMGDFIEHLPKDDGFALLYALGRYWIKDDGYIIISTPNFVTSYNHPKCAVFGNQNEIHRCRWMPKDFTLVGFEASVVEGRLLTVTMRKT